MTLLVTFETERSPLMILRILAELDARLVKIASVPPPDPPESAS